MEYFDGCPVQSVYSSVLPDTESYSARTKSLGAAAKSVPNCRFFVDNILDKRKA